MTLLVTNLTKTEQNNTEYALNITWESPFVLPDAYTIGIFAPSQGWSFNVSSVSFSFLVDINQIFNFSNRLKQNSM